MPRADWKQLKAWLKMSQIPPKQSSSWFLSGNWNTPRKIIKSLNFYLQYCEWPLDEMRSKAYSMSLSVIVDTFMVCVYLFLHRKQELPFKVPPAQKRLPLIFKCTCQKQSYWSQKLCLLDNYRLCILDTLPYRSVNNNSPSWTMTASCFILFLI